MERIGGEKRGWMSGGRAVDERIGVGGREKEWEWGMVEGR